ncbi:EAL domain-containing protein [Rhodoferax sp. TBRC 17198]|uniref:putative bifunctional diguanylate cyclase/phosphodiesterase n=1 Tax=Rhodoferax potami TaxID=3068338 RepID=UPI0028BD9B77|nr:EAL domain-containing protein [Rhodoferax sp. TBRC 17198]MDT7522795.1 EAL domain-containing protein [Rhodoferax sp. TBRC 17198]
MPTPLKGSASQPGTSFRAGLVDMYSATTPQAGKLRAAHVSAVVRLTPETMLANIGSAGLILWTFAPDIGWELLLWFAGILTLCLFALRSWRASLGRQFTHASPSTLHKATLHAMLLSGVWAFIPLFWFPGASDSQQLIIATLLTGMIGAGGFVLNPLPLASMAYVAVFSASTLAALLSGNRPVYSAVAAFISVYAPLVTLGALSAWRKSAALMNAESQSQRQEQMISVLLSDFEQNAGDALWETDAAGRLVHISPKLCELLQLREAQVAGTTWMGVFVPMDADGAVALSEALASGKPFKELPLSFDSAAGKRYIQINGKALLDEQGQLSGWRGVVSDVTEKVQSTNLLRQLAHTDSLTGLTNRFKLRESLAQRVADQQPLALLAIDLDRFKAINDRHGHSAGDEVLRLIAQRLQQQLAPDAMVARLGGDEFAVVLWTPEDIEQAPAVGRRLVNLLQEPLNLAVRRLTVGGSVGFTISRGEPITLDELMAQADIALYAAKGAGRSQCVAYTPELGAINQRRATLEHSLRQALHRQELQLYWQPKVCLRTRAIVGAETLMRWRHPVLGWISPGEFIPIAEQSGMITALGSWALLEACRMHSSALRGLTVSVNVSSIQLRDENFVAVLQDAIAEFRVDPTQLELELTESVFLDSADQALAMLHTLKKTGVKLAMDDFGTGYSSLSYLRSFPFDTLKIDRAFVIELVEKKDAEAVVHMITGLAQTLGMRTVCEGVETPEQLHAIQRAGCDEVQGYIVAKPMPLQEFVAFRKDWEHTQAPFASTPAG